MSRKYSISRPMPIRVRRHIPRAGHLTPLSFFLFGSPLFSPSPSCSPALSILIRESALVCVFWVLSESRRHRSSEDQRDDQYLTEHHHLGQQPREPPPQPPTMSTGDRGHLHITPNTTSHSQTTGFLYGTSGGSPLLSPADSSSLSVNYLPTKFGAGLVSRKRYGKDLSAPQKQGGGREAFKANESRMPGANDEDYDGVSTWFGHGSKQPALRWTKFKWVMFVANILVRTLFRPLPAPPLTIAL